MITFKQGDLFDSDAEAIVNAVNTVGVMGKGIALAFKERFPENYRRYAAACKGGLVQVGAMFATNPPELDSPKWIINFPTKQHWRSPSQMAWVESGLHDLRRFIVEHDLKSVAIPALGAGNGGLDWQKVRPLITEILADLPGVQVEVFEPIV